MSQPHAAIPTLLIALPHGGIRVCELSRTPFTIGRAQGNDLCLEDSALSAHHAQIIMVQNLPFLEDVGSSSGTFVNDARVERHHLRDADTIRLGAYRLTFREHHRAAGEAASHRKAPIADTTVVLSRRQEGPGPAPERHIGIVEILSGATGQAQYHLTKPTSLVGAQDDAVITLTGWFAPKTAAMISRKNEGYAVSQTESGKRILINGRVTQGEQALRHGDVVEVAGITMRFLLRAQSSDAV
ncbi:MAG: FHA domain-containing protein [Nitrospira sp.]|nr:FHA domain-containing protein [Nitrospira sp.]